MRIGSRAKEERAGDGYRGSNRYIHSRKEQESFQKKLESCTHQGGRNNRGRRNTTAKAGNGAVENKGAELQRIGNDANDPNGIGSAGLQGRISRNDPYKFNIMWMEKQEKNHQSLNLQRLGTFSRETLIHILTLICVESRGCSETFYDQSPP